MTDEQSELAVVSESPLRVLVVSNLFPPDVIGGAEIAADQLARGLIRRSHRVKVIGGYLSSRPFEVAEGEQEQALVHRIPLWSLDPDGDFHRPDAEATLRAIAARFRPDVIHFHNLSGLGAPLVLAARDHAAKVFCTLHDYWGFCRHKTNLRTDGSVCTDSSECALCAWQVESGLPARFRRDLIAWSLDHADALISPSRYLAAKYEATGLFDRPILVMSNGIDLSRFDRVGQEAGGTAPVDGRLRFVYLGSFGRHKGLRVLLQAVERLDASRELTGRWRMTCIGDGEDKPLLQAAIEERGLGDVLELEDALPNHAVPQRLRNADVIVNSSVWEENEPVTLLEAMATGLAQVAPRIGGIPELVEEGVSGLLFEPGDHESLADAMKQYVTDRDLVARHQRASLDRRGRFDVETVMDRIVERYRAKAAFASTMRSVIVCAGRTAGPQLSFGLHVANTLARELDAARFLWSGWIGDQLPDQTRLVWLLTGHTRDEAIRFGQARARGVPVLVPERSVFAADASADPGLFTYSSPLGALALAAAILGDSTRR